MEALKVESISKAQSWQRAGRAGREAPGKVRGVRCFAHVLFPISPLCSLLHAAIVVMFELVRLLWLQRHGKELLSFVLSLFHALFKCTVSRIF